MSTQNNKDTLLQFINGSTHTRLTTFASKLFDLQIKFTEKKQRIAHMQNVFQKLPNNANAMHVKLMVAYYTLAIVTDKMYATITTATHKCSSYKTILKNAAASCSAINMSQYSTQEVNKQLHIIRIAVVSMQTKLEQLYAAYRINIIQYNTDLNHFESVFNNITL